MIRIEYEVGKDTKPAFEVSYLLHKELDIMHAVTFATSLNLLFLIM